MPPCSAAGSARNPQQWPRESLESHESRGLYGSYGDYSRTISASMRPSCCFLASDARRCENHNGFSSVHRLRRILLNRSESFGSPSPSAAQMPASSSSSDRYCVAALTRGRDETMLSAGTPALASSCRAAAAMSMPGWPNRLNVKVPGNCASNSSAMSPPTACRCLWPTPKPA